MSQLYENFNTTNQTSPHFERHLKFALPVQDITCSIIAFINESQRCNFARTSPACLRQVYLFKYTAIYYCYLYSSGMSRAVGILSLLGICVAQFWIMGVLTSKFFCPAITEISKLLHMNENVAGVTILAFGNGAPELITSMVAMLRESRHVYTDCISTNLFITMIVGGAVMWVRPFRIEPYFFLRDLGFVIFYTMYIDYSIKNYPVTIVEAMVMMAFYIIYIAVVVADQFLLRKTHKVLESHVTLAESQHLIRQLRQIESQSQVLRSAVSRRLEVQYPTPNFNLWQQFLLAIDTLQYRECMSQPFVMQVYIVLKAVPILMLRLFVPQATFADTNQCWSKLLCVLQCALSPVLTVGICSNFGKFYGVPLWVLVPCVSLPLAIVAFIYSRTDKVPSWYSYMIILNLAASLCIFYMVARELVVSLETVGIALNTSHIFIGCTFFSWGSGVGDLIANVTMARQGLPRMAYAACFGAPLFNFFVSITIPYLYQLIKSENGMINVTEGSIGETSSVFLLIGCMALLLYGLTTDFHMRKTGGALGFILYALFLLMAIAQEKSWLHAYGADHTMDHDDFYAHFDED